METIVQSDFPAARRHIEEAARLLTGEDELSTRSRQAMAILIDAFLAAEFTDKGARCKVVDLDTHRRRSRPAGRNTPALG